MLAARRIGALVLRPSFPITPLAPCITTPVIGGCGSRSFATDKAPAKKAGGGGNPMAGPVAEAIPVPAPHNKSPRQIDDTPPRPKEEYQPAWQPRHKPVWHERPQYNHYKMLPKWVIGRLVPGDPDNFQYRLKAGALIERPPVCFGPEPEFVHEWRKVKERLEVTHRRKMPDEMLAPLRKKKNAIEEAEAESRQTRFEEMTPNPLRTDDDRKNNRKSLYRALDTSLFLVVKKNRKEHAWQFPQGSFEPTKEIHLRQTAMREIKEELGTDMRFHLMGNAPIGHLKYDYNTEFKSKKDPEFVGCKVFFFHALRTSGDPDLMSAVNTEIERRAEAVTAARLLAVQMKALNKSKNKNKDKNAKQTKQHAQVRLPLPVPELIDYAWATKDELLRDYFRDNAPMRELCKSMVIAYGKD